MHPHQHTNSTSKCIDLTLGMQRLHTTDKGVAMEALRILCDTLKKDLSTLEAAEQKNDLAAAFAVLINMQRGLEFSGTPRLEAACKQLSEKLKCAQELSQSFALVYEEAKLFVGQYQELLKH